MAGERKNWNFITYKDATGKSLSVSFILDLIGGRSIRTERWQRTEIKGTWEEGFIKFSGLRDLEVKEGQTLGMVLKNFLLG